MATIITNDVMIGDSIITSTSEVKNLGVTYDTNLSMESHVNRLCRSAYAQLRNIGHIRRYLTNDATRSLVSGLAMSRIDYCNGLLYGLINSSRKCNVFKIRRLASSHGHPGIVTSHPFSKNCTGYL